MWVVRYVAAPLMVLPIAWPWMLMLVVYGAMVLASGLVGLSIDLAVVLVELVKQNRGHIERSAVWACQSLRWTIFRYGSCLSAAHQGCEEVLGAVMAALKPVGTWLTERVPAFAWASGPVLQTYHFLQQAGAALYNFLHDEIVPVALDLAERLPLVEELMLRYCHADELQSQ